MAKLPYYKRYPRDYLSDENVALMSLEEEGAYNRLMDYCWLQESIPADVAKIARLCRVPVEKMEELWPALAACFDDAGGGRLTHPRMEKERAEAEGRSESARKAAEARWESERNAAADADAMRTHAATQSETMPYTEAEAEADVEQHSESNDSEAEPHDWGNPGAVLAPLIRKHLWLSDQPPPGHKGMGSDLDICRKLGKAEGVKPEELARLIAHCRDALELPRNKPFDMRLFWKEGRRDRINVTRAYVQNLGMGTAGDALSSLLLRAS